MWLITFIKTLINGWSLIQMNSFLWRNKKLQVVNMSSQWWFIINSCCWVPALQTLSVWAVVVHCSICWSSQPAVRSCSVQRWFCNSVQICWSCHIMDDWVWSKVSSNYRNVVHHCTTPLDMIIINYGVLLIHTSSDHKILVEFTNRERWRAMTACCC